MKYNRYTHKNIPQSLVEKWIDTLLKDYDSDELLQMLLELTSNRQRQLLVDEMQTQLKNLDYSVLKCNSLVDKMKYESFLNDIKPYYNERSLFE